jgi:DNA-binding NarL/FixJ family response regulator
MRPTLRLVPSPQTSAPDGAETSALPADRLADAGSVTAAPKLRLVPALPPLGSRRREDPLSELTAHVRRALALMAEGRSNTGIARRLWLTRTTVEKSVGSIFVKLSLSASDEGDRRVLAVIAFLRAR